MNGPGEGARRSAPQGGAHRSALPGTPLLCPRVSLASPRPVFDKDLGGGGGAAIFGTPPPPVLRVASFVHAAEGLLSRAVRTVPAFELAILRAIQHSKARGAFPGFKMQGKAGSELGLFLLSS
jgi:hypothetical protein